MKLTGIQRLAILKILFAMIGGGYLSLTLLCDGGKAQLVAGFGLLVFGSLLLVRSSFAASPKGSKRNGVRAWLTSLIRITLIVFLLGLAAIDVCDALVTKQLVLPQNLPFAHRRINWWPQESAAAADRRFEEIVRRKYLPAGGVALTIPATALALPASAMTLHILGLILRGPSYAPVLLRGRYVMTLAEARAAADAIRDPNDPGVPFGGVRLPSSAAPLSFSISGGVGAGKTRLINAAAVRVLREIKRGSGQRAIILDTKLEMLSFLHGLNLDVPIHIVNPRDVRGVEWWMQRDLRSPMSHAQAASIFVPEDGASNNRFFADGPRELISGILTVLSQCLPDWTFRDFLLATSNLEDLRLFLGALPETSRLLQLLGDEGTARNVMASLAAYLRKYDVVAAGWHQAANRLSLEEWMQSESIVLLGLDERIRAATSPVYRIMLQRLAEILLSQPESRTVHTHLFLDEVRHAKFPGLRELMTNARSKGTSVYLGYQDLEGMHDAFGEKVANEIIGQCGSLALLRTSSVKTANWQSEVIGDAEWIEYPWTDGPQGRSRTRQINRRRIVMPAEFMNLPMAGPARGVPGWFVSAAIGCWQGPVPWEDVIADLPTGSCVIPECVPRSEESQYLKPWTAEERTRIEAALRKHGKKP